MGRLILAMNLPPKKQAIVQFEIRLAEADDRGCHTLADLKPRTDKAHSA